MSSDVKALKGRHHGARHGRNFFRGSVCLLVIVALVLNFDARTGDWGTDRVIKETPDQMYEPTYPDYGNASNQRHRSFGVIFAANGPFLERAFESAMALGDGSNATIFSDDNGTRMCKKLKREFRKTRRDRLAGIGCALAQRTSSWGFRSAKLWAFTATPYDKTLYMDADAYPCAGYSWLRRELSPALERYDLLAVHSSFRDGFPHALHWLNAGVIAFDARSDAARAVFHAWLTQYEQAAREHAGNAPVTDQRLFNEAVLSARRARPMALPPEFNCKSNYKSVRYQWAKVVSPALYRRVRKNYRCCDIPSIGACVVDHECRFPNADAISASVARLGLRRR